MLGGGSAVKALIALAAPSDAVGRAWCGYSLRCFGHDSHLLCLFALWPMFEVVFVGYRIHWALSAAGQVTILRVVLANLLVAVFPLTHVPASYPIGVYPH